VRDAADSFVRAAINRDGAGYCHALTPESRALLVELAGLRLGGHPSCPRVVPRLPEALAGQRRRVRGELAKAQVRIRGGRATVRAADGDTPLTFRKRGGRWLVELGDLPGIAQKVAFERTCVRQQAALFAMPLPPPNAKGYARWLDAYAAGLRRFAAALDRLTPPPGGVQGLHAIGAGLRDSATILERVALRVRRGGNPADGAPGVARDLADLERSLNFGQRSLGVSCPGNPAARPDATAFRVAARRICVDASHRALPHGGADVASAVRRLRRLASVDRAAAARLAARRPPIVLRAAWQQTLLALRRTTDGLQTEADAVVAGDLPAVHRALRALELQSIRAAVGFRRLGLPACQNL
jgi:hypothetical protein